MNIDALDGSAEMLEQAKAKGLYNHLIHSMMGAEYILPIQDSMFSSMLLNIIKSILKSLFSVKKLARFTYDEISIILQLLLRKATKSICLIFADTYDGVIITAAFVPGHVGGDCYDELIRITKPGTIP